MRIGHNLLDLWDNAPGKGDGHFVGTVDYPGEIFGGVGKFRAKEGYGTLCAGRPKWRTTLAEFIAKPFLGEEILQLRQMAFSHIPCDEEAGFGFAFLSKGIPIVGIPITPAVGKLLFDPLRILAPELSPVVDGWRGAVRLQHLHGGDKLLRDEVHQSLPSRMLPLKFPHELGVGQKGIDGFFVLVDAGEIQIGQVFQTKCNGLKAVISIMRISAVLAILLPPVDELLPTVEPERIGDVVINHRHMKGNSIGNR